MKAEHIKENEIKKCAGVEMRSHQVTSLNSTEYQPPAE